MKLRSALLATLSLVGAAHATQLPYPTVSGLIDSQLPTNASGQIQAAPLRAVLHNMTDSVPLLSAVYPLSNAASTYTFQPTDQSSSITFTAPASTVTLQKPGTPISPSIPIARGWWVVVTAGPSSTVTLQPTGSTISVNGAAPSSSQVLAAGTAALISTDGSNYSSTILGNTAGSGTGSGTVNTGPQGFVPAYLSAGNAVSPIPPTCFPIQAFGGGAAISDNTAPLNAALAAFATYSAAVGACISFGPGVYNFASGVAYTYPSASEYSVSLRGSGEDSTVLQFASGANGISFAMGAVIQPSFHISDLTFATSGVGTATGFKATFLAAQQARISTSDIDRVAFRADNMAANTHYWGTAIDLIGVSGVNMDSVDITGAIIFGGAGGAASGGLGGGISIGGDPGINSFGVLFNLSNSNLEYLNIAFLYNADVQGVSIVNTNINFNTAGIVIPAGITPGALGVAGLLISNSYISNYGNDITILSPFDGLQMTGNNIIIFSNTTGVLCDSCSDSIITGNVFTAEAAGNVGNIGMSISNNSAGNSGDVTITGNEFNSLADGVVVGTGVSGAMLQSNTYSNNTANVLNSGTIKAGSCAGIGGTCTAGATP